VLDNPASNLTAPHRHRISLLAGNVVFKTMDEATGWLSQRLQAGPVHWTRTELMDLIAPFVHSRASSQKVR
jgi:hypothetical protein